MADPITYAHRRAKEQRFVSLENALKTVDVFAAPSCDPEMYEAFDKMRIYLTEMYKPKEDEEIIN